MMTVEPGERPLSPVHVHVNDHTPVHVHLKKPKKPSMTKDQEKSWKTSQSRARSKSPGPPSHWIPPPGRSTKSSTLTWQGPNHRLEVVAPEKPDGALALHLSDLDTDEEDKVANKMRKYEKKIDSLMNEVGTLKGEVSLQRSKREKEEELNSVKRELDVTAKQNEILKRSMDRMRDNTPTTVSHQQEQAERDALMSKLVEVEMDGQLAVKQAAAMRDTLRRVQAEWRVSGEDSALLIKQREQLLSRLVDFETNNRTLRQMLRLRHEQEAAGGRLAEQRDMLLKKLTETEEDNQRLRGEVMNRSRENSEVKLRADAQREEYLTMSGLQSSLESTRAHLQKQLRQKEADCNRMAVQIRSLESSLAQERIDGGHLRELLLSAREKAEVDKEALKKATRVQKHRAAKNEDEVGRLRALLMERDAMLSELRADVDNVRARSDKYNKEKSQAAAESSALHVRVAELEGILEREEEDTRARVDAATQRLQEKSMEASTLKLENERLATLLGSTESELTQTQSDMSKMRSNLRHYETLVDEYRSQMNRSRREADESIIQLEEQKRETHRAREEGEDELDKVKSRLQARLQELEPIPELLKTTELKLQENAEKLVNYEKRHLENTRLISELTCKVELQADEADQLRARLQVGHDNSSTLETRVESLEKKLLDVEGQNRDLLSTVAKREEHLHQINLKLDEKTRENSCLGRQLEAAMLDTRLLNESTREKVVAKDKAMQSRLLDLESQLSQARAEIARLKREKEESERKFNSRLYDLKDRLEQANSTNRSMQNYVQFLKTSYANVFGDSTVAPATAPLRSSTQPFL